MLDEMERHLMGNDADVVSAPADGRSVSYRNIVYGAVLVLLGLVGVIVGLAVGGSGPLIAVSVVGFVIMLGGVILAVTPTRGGGKGAARAGSEGPRPMTSTSRESFMDRMNDRWDKRQQER